MYINMHELMYLYIYIGANTNEPPVFITEVINPTRVKRATKPQQRRI